MRTAFVTIYESSDIGAWSGTPYFMGRSLESDDDSIVRIGGLERRGIGAQWAGRVRRRILRQNYPGDRAKGVLRGYAKQLQPELAQGGFDAIVAPGTIPIADLETDVPIFIWSDATFDSLLEFYPGVGWTGLSRTAVQEGRAAEHRAFDKSELCIFSSTWAAENAMEGYDLDPTRVEVVPFGANLVVEEPRSKVDEAILAHREDSCTLLFVGAEWERKGGDMAVDAAAELSTRGPATRLILLGCQPPPRVSARGSLIDVRGFVNKREPGGREHVEQAFRSADVLILPSLADATPMVIAEAASFGVPTIAADVGGIADLVLDGVTGYLLPRGASAGEYASCVQRAMDGRAYPEMASASRDLYERRLNWSTAGQSVRSLMSARLQR